MDLSKLLVAVAFAVIAFYACKRHQNSTTPTHIAPLSPEQGPADAPKDYVVLQQDHV